MRGSGGEDVPVDVPTDLAALPVEIAEAGGADQVVAAAPPVGHAGHVHSQVDHAENISLKSQKIFHQTS